MGDKGARLSGTSVEVGDAVVADLAPLGDVRAKKMFGGVGVFCDDVMFVIVDREGTVFLRTDEESAGAFVDAGGHKHGRMPYHSVPAGVIDDEAAFVEWGRRALETARAAKR